MLGQLASKWWTNLKAEALKEAEASSLVEDASLLPSQINKAFECLQESLYRAGILEEGQRSDGRAADQLRPISSSVDILPRVHGSALFQRGETQSLVVATLGTPKDAQDMDAVAGGATSKSFHPALQFPALQCRGMWQVRHSRTSGSRTWQPSGTFAFACFAR